MHGAHLRGRLEWRDLGLAAGRPRMQLQVVVERDRFLARLLDERDSYGDLKFTPSEEARNELTLRCGSEQRTQSRIPRMEACPHLQAGSLTSATAVMHERATHFCWDLDTYHAA